VVAIVLEIQTKGVSKVGTLFLATVAVIVIIGSGVFFGQMPSTSTNSTTSTFSSVSGASSTGLSRQFPSTQQTTNSTSGLDLSVSANSTTIPSEDSINISISLTNVLATTDNLTASNSWALTGNSQLRAGPCDYDSHDDTARLFFPVGISIFRGYYTPSNVSLATALPIWAAIECPVQIAYNGTQSLSYPLNIAGYALLPYSSKGYYSAYYDTGYNKSVNYGKFEITTDDQALVYSANGTFFGVNTLNSSLPSVYTIAAGDEWGQLVLLHFEVSPSDNVPLVADYIASSQAGGCSESINGTHSNVPCDTDMLSQALLFDCASQAASNSGCTLDVFGIAPYNITVWYPYYNGNGEPSEANCKYQVAGEASTFYGKCYLVNSTAFALSPSGY
jgi:hypothetical protein